LHGEKPIYYIFNTSDEMNQYVLDSINKIVRESDYKYNDICISSRTKRSVSEIKKFIHSYSIPYYDLTKSTGDKEGVSLSTFHNMKGLEFKAVILYDVSENTLPNIFYGYEALSDSEKKSYIKSEKLYCMAMTRAIGCYIWWVLVASVSYLWIYKN
jgi:superfamily I DNA/RNA helicase